MDDKTYLKNELNARISFTYTHSQTTMSFVITIWSVLIALVSLFIENITINYKVVLLVAPFIVLITLFYIFFASQKYRENLDQIIKVSTYCLCFYNSQDVLDEKVDSWELVTMNMKNDKEYDIRRKKEVLPKMNGEYTFFAVASCIINTILLIVSIVVISKHNDVIYALWTGIEYLMIMIVSICLVEGVYYNTTLKNFHKEHINMFLIWLQYLIDYKYATKEELLNKYSKLNKTLKNGIKSLKDNK